MDLYICEKPAQGKDLAGVLGVRQYNDGYITGGDIAVTWGFGHLYEQLMPEDYDPRYEGYESWSDLSLLPFVPSSWGYKMKEKTAKQTKTVLGLIQKASTVYISTDFDREGEAIGRILLAQANYKGPIKRVCLTALDNQSIKKALANVKDGSETLPLFHAALARSRADFLVGMNLTRLYTALARSIGFREILNIGRVLTATVNLVCERERAIASFQPTPFWTIQAQVNTTKGSFKASWKPPQTHADANGRCNQGDFARGAAQACNGAAAQIVRSEQKPESETAPLLFDLTSLQQYANKRWGYTADEVLAIGQALYEKHKLLTYPRSDSRYLPQDQQGDVPDVLSAMVKTDPSIAGLVQLVDPERKCRVFNDSKVTSHHGIIPTFQAGSIDSLNEQERNIYDIVRRYYLAQFLPAHEYLRSEITVQCGPHLFVATGNVTTSPGWKTAFGSDNDIDPPDEEVADEQESTGSAALPAVVPGDACILAKTELGEKVTRPLPYFTEAALLGAMENIARFETNEQLRKVLNEKSGIGTPATRAGMIEGAVVRKFFVRKKRAIRATDKAHALMAILPPAIKQPSMTALWEQDLDRIEDGTIPVAAFEAKITNWVCSMVNQLKAAAPVLSQADGPMAKAFEAAMPQKHECVFGCGGQMMRFKGSNGMFWGCQNAECKKTCSDSRGKPQKPLASDEDAPDCPTCGGPTKLRKGKPKDGKRAQNFWGCCDYPNCKGILPFVKPKPGAKGKLRIFNS